MKPTEDFLNVVMCAHVSAADKQLMTAGNATDDCMPRICSPRAFCGMASMKEGDGDKIVLNWKLLLPIFQ